MATGKKKNPYAVALGTLGGKSKSARKVAASRRNVRKAQRERAKREAL